MWKPGILRWGTALLTAVLLLMPLKAAHAYIDGISGTSFQFAARQGRLTTPDGGNPLFWGFADISPGGKGTIQYPGPTLIIKQGDTVTIKLTNELKEPVSIMFPGMTMLTSTSPVFSKGQPGKITSLVPEAAPGGTQVYTFRADSPGTFYYQSGSNQAVQLRMGLFGALIVRPSEYRNAAVRNKVPFGHYSSTNGVRHPQVRLDYNSGGIGGVAYKPSNGMDMSTAYDREVLYMASEMDPKFQQWMEFEADKAGNPFDFSTWKANYWFINGRNAPDTMAMANAQNLPTQPYNCMPLFHPGERLLLRIINMGQDFHPLHTHGNHLIVVAEDGNLLQSAGGTGADLSRQQFTVTMGPGKTVDGIFTWTGKGLGWDIYGDNQEFRPYEYIADHGKTFNPHLSPAATGTTPQLPDQGLPVTLPGIQETIAGTNWSGSPFLASAAPLPPGEGGFNSFNGFFYMWHSHAERELTNNDIFPGGFLTMAGIVPWPTSGDNLTAKDEYMP